MNLGECKRNSKSNLFFFFLYQYQVSSLVPPGGVEKKHWKAQCVNGYKNLKCMWKLDSKDLMRPSEGQPLKLDGEEDLETKTSLTTKTQQEH